MSDEMQSSFVGQIRRFSGQDDPSFEATLVIEVCDVSDKEVEIAWDEGKKRTYFRFRLADFQQAIKGEEAGTPEERQ